MSVVPSLSTVLSLLSFLTTVFALARVGAAAFSANQNQAQRPWPYAKAAQPAASLLQLQLGGPGSSMSLAQAVRLGVSAEGEKEKGVGYIGGHDLVRWTGNAAGVRRQGLLFRPPSPFPDHAKPLSMAKLIMSRHQNQRRPSRPTPAPARRPPGLPSPSPSFPSSRSRLVEEV